MKNRKVAAYLGIALFALAAGCKKDGGRPSAPAAEAAGTESFGDSADREAGNISGSMNKDADREEPIGTDLSENQEVPSGINQPGGERAPKGTDSPADTAQGEQKSETLIGNISSIGEGSMVISRFFEEGSGVLVAPADGSPEEALVMVYVSEETQYEVKTVKNGGVNGASDVEAKSGSFSDLEQDAAVDLLGYYEGEEFIAEKICIYRFV